MTRHQALELLLTRRIPEDVPSIEATLRAITSRLDVASGTEEYEQAHERINRAAAPAAAPAEVLV